MPTRALTWAIFATAAGIVAVICAAILRPFAHVIAWAATLGTLCDPLQQKLVERTGRALLRGDGGVHPAVLHHAMRRTEAEIVHVIGNIEPAMNHARRNDQHITDLQLDFA